VALYATIRDGEYRLWGWQMMYQQFSYRVYNDLLASSVGLLALLPLLVVDTESLLSNVLEGLCIQGNRSLGNDFRDCVNVLTSPVLNDFVLVCGSDPDILVVHQSVRRHANNEETCGSQDYDQGIGTRIHEESLLEAVIVHFLQVKGIKDGRCKRKFSELAMGR
jgi:hypothetical protein